MGTEFTYIINRPNRAVLLSVYVCDMCVCERNEVHVYLLEHESDNIQQRNKQKQSLACLFMCTYDSTINIQTYAKGGKELNVVRRRMP